MREVNMEMAKIVYDSACSALDGMGIKYDKVEKDLVILFGHRGDDMNHNLIMIVNAEQEAIQLVEKLPFDIDPAKSNEVASAVCLVNGNLLSGGFKYNLESHLEFRVTQLYSGSLIGEETIRRMLLALVFTVEEYDDKFMALNKGYLKVADFKQADND